MGFASCIKFIIILFNVLFAIVGLGIVGLGTYYYIVNKNMMNDAILYIAIASMLVGCITFLIAFCGCCAASTENHCLLLTYGIVVFLMMVAKAGIAAFLFIKKDALVSAVTSPTYNSNERLPVLQLLLYCCHNCIEMPSCTDVFERRFKTMTYVVVGAAGFSLLAAVAGLYAAHHVRKNRHLRN